MEFNSEGEYLLVKGSLVDYGEYTEAKVINHPDKSVNKLAKQIQRDIRRLGDMVLKSHKKKFKDKPINKM